MRIFIALLIGIHALIHLFGFLKAFGLAEFSGISQAVSKPYGLLWLLGFLLLTMAMLLFIMQSAYWWMAALLGVLLSQFLVIHYWSDAKYGTILNGIILVFALFACMAFLFQNKLKHEIRGMHAASKIAEHPVVTEQMIAHVPEAVQKWLRANGTVGKEAISTVYLEQDLQMLMKPEQTAWTAGQAKQYFTVEPPAFHWSVDLNMRPGMRVAGRDKFEKGQGEMLIKLFSALPIVNAKNDDKVSQASLQRYLAEIVWFPSAALSPFISWRAIDQHSAEATMRYNGTEGSGIFHFDKNGHFTKFVAMRYKDAKDAEPTEWTVTSVKSAEKNGIIIPVECKVSWKLSDGYWTWLKLEILKINYNLSELPLNQ